MTKLIKLTDNIIVDVESIEMIYHSSTRNSLVLAYLKGRESPVQIEDKYIEVVKNIQPYINDLRGGNVRL